MAVPQKGTYLSIFGEKAQGTEPPKSTQRFQVVPGGPKKEEYPPHWLHVAQEDRENGDWGLVRGYN